MALEGAELVMIGAHRWPRPQQSRCNVELVATIDVQPIFLCWAKEVELVAFVCLQLQKSYQNIFDTIDTIFFLKNLNYFIHFCVNF